MNLCAYFQDAFSTGLYVIDTGLASTGDCGATPNLDSWDYNASWDYGIPVEPGPYGSGLIRAWGLAISPDGTKIAIPAANGFTKQYKIQVWNIGFTPDVASTIDAELSIYLVNATLVRTYTKTAVGQGTETINCWAEYGAATEIAYWLSYGVRDLQVDNDGNIWFLELEDSRALIPSTISGADFTEATERYWQKAHVQQLLVGDTNPTLIGTFLTFSSSCPGNPTINQQSSFGNTFCPGAFTPLIINGLWDGPRGRVLGQARDSYAGVTAFSNGSCVYTAGPTCPSEPDATGMTVVDGAAGTVTAGTHYLYVINKTSAGVFSIAGNPGAGWTAAGSKKANVSVIPLGPVDEDVIARLFVSTKADSAPDSPLYLVPNGTINNNIDTTAILDYADADLVEEFLPGLPWPCADTAQSILADPVAALNFNGIFSPAEIISVAASGLGPDESTPDIAYGYIDQIPNEVYRVPTASWIPPLAVGAVIVNTYFELPIGAGTIPQIYPVRRTASQIAAYTRNVGVGEFGTLGVVDSMIRQDNTGAIELVTVTDSIGNNPGFYGWDENSAALPSVPLGVLLVDDRQFLIDNNWQLREATLSSGAITFSATPETVTPDNPDDVDSDTFTRYAVSGQGSYGIEGTPVLFPTSTVS